ncbi:MAG: SH3 domain-containing protein [Clostridia bacterium]|nr:SH3 domain-containing protein [Clostridia bacterium]
MNRVRWYGCLSFILALIIAFTGVPVTHADTTEEEATYGQATTDNLKFRSSPDTSTDDNILGTVSVGEKFEILATEGAWYRVMYNGQVGYIHGDYVYVISSSGTRGAYVISDGTELKGGPSDNSYTVALLSAGLGVNVKGIVGEWYYVISGLDSGYVRIGMLRLTSSATAETPQLRYGMEGEDVRAMQLELFRRGFLSRSDCTGTFNDATLKALKEFQKLCGISQDGIAGTITQDMLANSNVRKDNALYNQLLGSVVLLDWFNGGNEWFTRYSVATVTDVRTGLSFRVRRFGGWYHADCEPLTAYDTQVMFRISNYQWSWNRRPIWVTLNGKTVAASMHTFPHMANPTPSNNFDGHFCIHLYHSKVHENSSECPRHQACVMEAYSRGRG